MIGNFLLKSLILLASLSLLGCTESTPERQNPLKRLADGSTKFKNPSPGNIIPFPEAHAPKKSYRQEWWYLTANLTTEEGQSLATQWTLFRRGVEDRHWYFAHAALADKQHHLSAYRDGREELGTVTINTLPFNAMIDDWHWASTGELLPARLQYGSRPLQQEDEGQAYNRGSDWQVRLNLSDEQTFFLQGEEGFSQKHHKLNIASHYYSQPFIKITGQVFWQGKWQEVTGDAWFDREWGSQMLAADQQGWDWFSLRLDEGTALMVYRIRSTVRDYLYGSIMKRSGEVQTLSEQDIQISILGSVDAYPNAFNIRIPDEGINLDVKVINDKQIMRMGIEYFEGMVRFSGSHQGQGFLEMTGYSE